MADFNLMNYIGSSVSDRTTASGLVSGIDTTALLDKIMQKESLPLQKLETSKTTLTNRQTALNEVADELTEFRTYMNTWKLQSNFIMFDTVSSDETVATVSASGAAQDRSFNVTVNHTSRNETFFSGDYVTGTTASQLKNLDGYNNGVSEEGELTLTVDGTALSPINYYTSNTLSEIIGQIESLDPNLQVSTVNSSSGLKLFISGKTTDVNISIADTGDLLQTLKMTESYSSSDFATGGAGNTLAAFNGAGTGITADGTLSITYNGTIVPIAYQTTQTLNQVLATINANPTLTGKVDAYYGMNSTGDALKLFVEARNPEDTVTISDAPGASSKGLLEMLKMAETFYSTTGVAGNSSSTTLASLSVVSGSLTLQVGTTGYSIGYTVSGSETLDNLVNTINTTPDLHDAVFAWVDNSGGEMVLNFVARDGGTDIALTDDSNLLSTFNIDTTGSTGHNAQAVHLDTADFYQTSQEAEISLDLDGVFTTVNSTSNVFDNLMDGVSVTVKRASTTPVQLSVSKDIEGMVTNTKEFITKYNEIMSNLYLRMDPAETNATSTSDEDLTAEQLALRGVLKDDPLIREVFNRMRSMVYSDLDSSNKEVYYATSISGSSSDTLSSFGITAGGTLTISVDGVSASSTITYAATDTVETVLGKLNTVSPYLQATIQESSGSFNFYYKGSKDFNIVDVPTGSTGFRDYFLNTHQDAVLQYDYLTEIGIGSSDGYTGGYLEIVKGQILLDETKFTTALMDDADAVWKTFGANEDFGDTTVKGFGTQLSDYVYDVVRYGNGRIAQVAGISGSINRELRLVNTEIVEWATRLTQRYEALTAKFSRMEQTIQQYQAQGAQLTQAIANLTGSTSA